MSDLSWRTSQVLVGCCLRQPDLLSDLLLAVNPGDLDPPCDVTLTLLARQRQAGVPFEPHRLQRDVARARPNVPRNWVASLVACGRPEAFQYTLGEFRTEIARRRLRTVGAVVAQAAEFEDLRLGIEQVEEKVADARAALLPMSMPMIDGEVLWDYEAPPETVLLPTLLWRQAKVVVTGFEGDGKSTLLRQFAMAPALGLHPFKPHGHVEPIRTLLLDLENPPAVAQTEMRAMLDTLVARGNVRRRHPFEGRFKFDFRPEGLDILGSGRDREYLHRMIAMQQPDLLLIGPVYRLAAAGGDLDEEKAGRVIDHLNHLRQTYDLAIMTEAHCPHGVTDHSDPNKRRVLRPSGSSAWMRFPEIGRGLRRQTDPKYGRLGRVIYRLEEWRQDRTGVMRFPEFVSRAVPGQVWFDDCTDEALTC